MRRRKEKPRQKTKKSPKKVRIWTFSRRLLALCLLPMTVVCVLLTAVSTVSLKENIELEIYHSLQMIATSVNETYTNLYEGDYTVDYVGKVRKGDTEINGNYQLVDALQKQTGFDVSLLFQNTRLLTTLRKENGARVNGTPADKTIYTQIEAGETLFLRDTMIFEKECYVLYQPLVNSDQTVMGAIEVVKDSESVRQTIREQVLKIIRYSLMPLIAAAGMVGILSRSMVVKMKRITRFLKELVGGRLDQRPDQRSLKSKDELGDIYRGCVQVQDTLKEMVEEIKASCNNLTSAAAGFMGMADNTTEKADGVKTAVREISGGARIQADYTVTAKEHMTKISSQIEKITLEVDSMAEYAADMSGKEKESQLIITELSETSDQTRNSVSKATEQIERMKEAVNGIKQAVGIIQNIADETDLLSLNASIEAARAGDSGRGFAVVAEQICKLALQSNESGKEIERILEEVINTAGRMETVMEEVGSNMEVQQQKLEKTRNTCSAVAAGVEKSLENMESIKQKIDVLHVSGDSVSDVVEKLSEISEENAESASDTMETAERMSDTMQQVQESSKELLQLSDRLKEVLYSFGFKI